MIIQPSYDTYLDAKSLLTQGELVAFPTETVYGLGANALDESAVKKIFETKGRPQKNPIIVHVGDKSQIAEYAIIENEIQQTIIDKLMPGPLTILLKRKNTIPDVVTAGSEFVGIRIPSNQVALHLLQTVQLPLAAPSANISTKPSPTSAAMVADNYLSRPELFILDGGGCEVGIESTVVKVEDQKVIITRPGYITKEDIQSLFPANVEVDYATSISEITPGNMFKHYAPHAKVHIISSIEEIIQESSALIATTEFLSHQQSLANLPKNTTILQRWTHSNLITCANKLFALYHQCDQENYTHIYIEALPEIGLGYAIMNRVKKSAE